MKRNVLSRYERDEAGRVVIDVSASRPDELYNNFDKSSPYIRRDLDKDLTDYLVSCVLELDDAPFVIRFTILSPMEESRVPRVRRSVKEYFVYLRGLEHRRLARMLKRSVGFLVLGVGILSALVWNGRVRGGFTSIIGNVVSEGLTVLAWVSLWEAIAVVLMEWLPRRKSLEVYRRIAEAELLFRTIEPKAPSPSVATEGPAPASPTLRAHGRHRPRPERSGRRTRR